MWKKHVLLPLWLGLVTSVPALNAYDGAPSPSKALYFIENKGQVTDQYLQVRRDLDFKLAAGNGLNIFIGKGKLEYQWGIASPPSASLQEVRNDVVTESYELYRMDVRLIGANSNATVVTEGLQSYFERYFLSWVNTANSNVGVVAHTYSKITYKDIYPHIDWVFYFNTKGQLEHDFVVHPGGNVSDIQIQYSGADGAALNPDGSLTAFTAMGSVTEQTPYAYNKHTNQTVASSFKLSTDHILSFEIDPYVGTLVIDPVLEWETYFGGAVDDECFALTTDKWDYVYMAGSTGSKANIATTGAFQTTFGLGTTDAFLSKWNKEGHLLWATYLGGTNVDVAKGLGCDTFGNVHIGGYTNSTAGMATPGSYQETKSGTANGQDAFIVNFDSAGIRNWGTYFGGTNNDANTSFTLTTSPDGHVFIAGNTQSLNLPTTPGVHQPALSGGIDGFVAHWDTDGKLIWSTFYGGIGTDDVHGIAVDPAGNVYVTGRTSSTTGIASSGAHQSILGGDFDAFVSKFNSTGQQIWGTYAGGSGNDEGRTIALNLNTITIAGFTGSNNAISTTNAYQSTIGGGGSDGFLMQLDKNGSVKWSTYYGGEEVDGVFSIVTDNYGAIYLTGRTGSTLSIATAGTIQEMPGSPSDCFIAKFNSSGTIVWGSYYGGTGSDYANAISTSGDKNIFIGGRTSSSSGMSSADAHQIELKGGRDAFLVRINDCDPPSLLSSILGDTLVCSGSEIQYGVTGDSLVSEYNWLLPDGWEGTSDSNKIIGIAGVQDGIIQVYALNACGGISDTQSIHVTVLPVPQPEIRNQNSILSTTKPFASYQWLWKGDVIDGAIDATYIPLKNGSYQVKVINEGGCEGISDSLLIDDLSINSNRLQSGIQVYPNPVADAFILQSDYSGTAQVFNIEGKVVMGSTPIQKGQHKIDVSTLSAGIYLLRLQTDKGWWHLKLVKY